MNKGDRNRLLSTNLLDKDWLGVVIDNKDTKSSFRCKIRVFGLFDELEDDVIPWAFPANNGVFAGSNGGFGSGSVPKIGTIVKVHFSSGNKYAPEYYSVQNINSALQEEIADDYDGTHVLVYDEDEGLKITYQKGSGLKIHLRDSHVTINPDTSITIEHSSSESIIELLENKINIVSSKEVNVTTKKCTIDSPDINLGKDATEALIKGNEFQQIFDSHTHPTPAGPTAPPIISMSPALSDVSTTL